jgi:hypothetical protein
MNIVVRSSLVPLTTVIVSAAEVDAARAQVFAPLFASVSTMTLLWLWLDAVATQLVGNVEGVLSVAAGPVAIAAKPAGNVIVIVAPAPSPPVAEVVKPQVHVEEAAATSEVGAVEVTDTAVTAVGVIVAPELGATPVVSADVATAKFAPP